MRALARQYEKNQECALAIAQWRQVVDADPHDHEAQHRLDDLSVQEHLAARMHRR